ncbi:hypothetical protein QN277_026020 [Acacia crassicarpa]|uniref:VQ domain-containing protein n=1 Tax=Acacia crassicarpa TaxID=499986 RepID=A0AAE1J9C1_9FABA|nr:hypothetical protein QN277_026020 [Acacia crassicarpa]
MDSGHSTGSLQSSSGGDDEYDSRADSMSAFFNHHPNPPIHHHVASSTHTNAPPVFGFDPSSNYLDPIPPSNFDMVWARPTRSDPNRSDLGGFNPSSSSNQLFFSGQLGGQTSHHQQPLVPESSSRGLIPVSGGGGGNIDLSAGGNNVGRNPKKRSRASRRAPTTVLTTDTTNFRAMVQEFTGIPAPPFVYSPFQRSRLDLLGSHAAVRSPPPTYNLLRPFAQKPQSYHHQPFLSSSLPPGFPSTAVDPLLASSSSTTNSNSIIYPSLSSDLCLLKQQPSLNVNLHNSVLNFASSIQLGSSSSDILASKTQAPLGIHPANSHLKVGGFEEFGLNHVDVNNADNTSGLHNQNMVSSSSEWAERMGTNNDNGGDHGVMRSGNDNLGDSLAASSSNFHGEKPATTTTESVAAAGRNEGMVESWINCSTD